MIRKGLFAFEGIDGSGKTTQTKLLIEKLEGEGSSTFLSKSRTKEQKQALEQMTEKFDIERRSIAMLFLYQALHEKQCREALRAIIQDDALVVADRWNGSFWVYHLYFGPLRGETMLLRMLDRLAFKGQRPQLVFLLDVPVEVALERKKNRKNLDQLDQESFESYVKGRKRYLEIASECENWHIVQGDQSREVVHREIWQKIKNYI